MRKCSFPLALVLLSACSAPPTVTLTVIAVDGGDPWTGPNAASHARVSFGGDGGSQTVAVGARGDFRFDIQPASPTAQVAVQIDALKNNVVVAGGSTPPVYWQTYVGHTLSILMHPTDSLLEAPGRFRTGRADFKLVPAGLLGVAAVTLPAVSATTGMGEIYDLTVHGVAPLTKVIPGEFDGDTTVLPVVGGLVMTRASRTIFYADDQQSSVAEIVAPSGRPLIVDATAMLDTQSTSTSSGGWFIGGVSTDDRTTPLSRIDRINGNTSSGYVFGDPVASLQVGRRTPQVIEIQRPDSTVPRLWVVGGGQRAGARAMEIFSTRDATMSRELDELDPTLELVDRVGFAAVCIAWDTLGCTRLLVLGGTTPAGSQTREDVLLDASCLRLGRGRCNPVLAHGAWLSHRRVDAVAAVAARGRVLVAGGHEDTGVSVFDVETVNIESTDAPAVGRIVGTIGVRDPAIVPVANGEVMLAGGLQPDDAPSPRIWLYRY